MDYPEDSMVLMRELDVPCWTAGGYLLDYFTNSPWRDMDIFFPDNDTMLEAINRMKSSGYELIDIFDHNIIKGGAIVFKWRGRLVDFMVNGASPEETIRTFDFTVCCCSLDSEGELVFHKEYFDHIDKRRLEYTGGVMYSDIQQRLKRLKRYILKGYGIDQGNIVCWIDSIMKQQDQIFANTVKYANKFDIRRRSLKC
tara:strand:+ start:431 stop:1024 length:594 start_codon:yes stop_codon:yes gene_type:complete